MSKPFVTWNAQTAQSFTDITGLYEGIVSLEELHHKCLQAGSSLHEKLIEFPCSPASEKHQALGLRSAIGSSVASVAHFSSSQAHWPVGHHCAYRQCAAPTNKFPRAANPSSISHGTPDRKPDKVSTMSRHSWQADVRGGPGRSTSRTHH